MPKYVFAGRQYESVREYLEIVQRNAWMAVAAGVVVCTHTQLLMQLLYQNGDDMDAASLRRLTMQLGEELGAAQQTAGVTSEDLQRVGVEMSTVAGDTAVVKRFEVALAKAADMLCSRPGCAGARGVLQAAVSADVVLRDGLPVPAMAVGDVGCVAAVVDAVAGDGEANVWSQMGGEVLGVPKKLNKRLRKKQRRREEAVIKAAMCEAAVEAVDEVQVSTRLVKSQLVQLWVSMQVHSR